MVLGGGDDLHPDFFDFIDEDPWFLYLMTGLSVLFRYLECGFFAVALPRIRGQTVSLGSGFGVAFRRLPALIPLGLMGFGLGLLFTWIHLSMRDEPPWFEAVPYLLSIPSAYVLALATPVIAFENRGLVPAIRRAYRLMGQILGSAFTFYMFAFATTYLVPGLLFTETGLAIEQSAAAGAVGLYWSSLAS